MVGPCCREAEFTLREWRDALAALLLPAAKKETRSVSVTMHRVDSRGEPDPRQHEDQEHGKCTPSRRRVQRHAHLRSKVRPNEDAQRNEQSRHNGAHGPGSSATVRPKPIRA